MMLTPRRSEILQLLVAGQKLTVFFPGGWYIGKEPLGGAVGWYLLRRRFIKIHDDYVDKDDFWKLEITKRGRDVLGEALDKKKEHQHLSPRLLSPVLFKEGFDWLYQRRGNEISSYEVMEEGLSMGSSNFWITYIALEESGAFWDTDTGMQIAMLCNEHPIECLSDGVCGWCKDAEVAANLLRLIMTKTRLCPFGGGTDGVRDSCKFGHPGCACSDYAEANPSPTPESPGETHED